eukprot:TRINITY_DN8779_c0_g3_i1.p1 TRINITY_DN8779_c0_g3~~TRINITY_DN8779_c0_g3_i1.p1  ORF type:complete len:167 (+),score=14.61 TRINITY_DN8779_c0_g3_i1:268-768(+)
MNSPRPIFRCQFNGCGHAYKSKFSLKRHKQKHQRIRQHCCKYCHKFFALAQYLREHIHTHTGERPYVCKHPGCGKSFRQSGKFSLHKKSHENAAKTTYRVPAVEQVESLIEAMNVVFEEIKKFTVPYYFYSKILPLPSQLEDNTFFAKLPEKMHLEEYNPIINFKS